MWSQYIAMNSNVTRYRKVGNRNVFRLNIRPKDPKDVRGTKKASEMIDLMIDNWDQLQEKFEDYTESDKEELMDHFNCAVENLGDALFGSDASPEDFKTFMAGLEEEKEQVFLIAVKEALLIEYE